MNDDIKKLSVKEFREHGYLQELNRWFLHPLGLALEVVIGEDGNERFGEVWDYRDDPEGMVYGPGVIDPEKVQRVASEMDQKLVTRVQELGYMTQPVNDPAREK